MLFRRWTSYSPITTLPGPKPQRQHTHKQLDNALTLFLLHLAVAEQGPVSFSLRSDSATWPNVPHTACGRTLQPHPINSQCASRHRQGLHGTTKAKIFAKPNDWPTVPLVALVRNKYCTHRRSEAKTSQAALLAPAVPPVNLLWVWQPPYASRLVRTGVPWQLAVVWVGTFACRC